MAYSRVRSGDDASWPQDWGRLLRLARQVTGLTLTEVSARSGLSKGYLSKLESGHRSATNPSRATLAALARALPSFRPLAHVLEPSAPLASLTFAEAAPELPPVARDADGSLSETPVRLGWREMETLMALLVLERSGAPTLPTIVMLARAVGRSVADLEPVLERLVAQGALTHVAPPRVGLPATVRTTADFESLTGLTRVGDALVLAATLLSQTPTPPRRAPSLE